MVKTHTKKTYQPEQYAVDQMRITKNLNLLDA
jgi:hypothetical protein